MINESEHRKKANIESERLEKTKSSVRGRNVTSRRFDRHFGWRPDRPCGRRRILLSFLPFNLVVTRSVYVDTGSITAGTTVLPPNCSPANCPTPVTAVTSSAYPYVFNNDTVDGNFGITSKIFLDQITPFGWVLSSLEVPNSSQHGVAAYQRSNGHQLLLKIGIGGEPVDRRQRPDLHGLFRADRRN